MASKGKESGFDKLARLIKSESDDIRKHMPTKEDLTKGLAVVRSEMATKADIAAIRVDAQ